MILYHVSYDIDNPLDYTFIPRVPDSRTSDEDDEIERVCFSDSIQNCIRGISGRLMQKSGEIIVYKYEIEVESPNIISWEKLYEEGLVNDAALTHEYWYVGKEPLHLVGKKYRIIQKSQKEQIVIGCQFRDKMLEVLANSNINPEYYMELPAYHLLDLINKDDKLIEIAKEKVGHQEYKEDYDADLDILLWGEASSPYEWKIDWDSLVVIEKSVVIPL